MTRSRMKRLLNLVAVGCLFGLLNSSAAQACVGQACLLVWSTADGGGALTVQWDVAKKIQTFQTFCTPGNTQCLFTAIDPGFMGEPVDEDPSDSYFVVKDGTTVRAEIVSADAGVSMNINGQKLTKPGESALLGTMPTIHNHPSWQIVVPGGDYRDFTISYRLTTTSPSYTNSEVLSVVVTNALPPAETPTATPMPTPTPTPCAGDCSADGEVTIDELVTCVNMALGTASPDACAACDVGGDGEVTVDEIVASVNAALAGCPMAPVVTLDELQSTLFTPSCAVQFCHDPVSRTGNLELSSAEQSYTQLVGVTPDIAAAASAGQLRVDPGHPENSFLLIKLTGPPRGQGSKMPLTGPPLTDPQIESVRSWILQGASR